jgi:hypothetical protein
MTLPASGSITLAQVAGELGISLPLSLGDSRVLALAGKSGLPISLSDLYGKSGQAPRSATASGSDQQYNSASAPGTGSATGTVFPAGGSGGYSFAWSLVSSTNSPTVGALNASTVGITKSYNRNANGSASATFNVTVTDSQGHTYTVNGVTLSIEWYNNQ